METDRNRTSSATISRWYTTRGGRRSRSYWQLGIEVWTRSDGRDLRGSFSVTVYLGKWWFKVGRQVRAAGNGSDRTPG